MRFRQRFIPTATLLLLALLLVPTVAAEWPMEGANPEHTGEQKMLLLGPAAQWTVQVDGELLCPPSTGYGRLYLGTSDGYLRVLDEADGQMLWEVKVGATICATPLVDSQLAIVPSGNTLSAIALNNKTLKWSFEAVGNLKGSPILSNNLVYIGSEDKRVYAIDKLNGELQWSLKLDDVVAASPSVSGLTVVVGTVSGMVYGIHRTEGRELWHVDLGSPVSTPACISQTTAILGTFGGRLYAMDLDDGSTLWTFPHPMEDALEPILTTPVTNSGLVYFGADHLYCLAVASGLKVWTFETGDTVRGSPAIATNHIVFGSYDGLLRCLDKNTGAVLWRFHSGTVFRSGVSIEYDRAFIGGQDGKLYARSILNDQAPKVLGPSMLEAEVHDSVSFDVNAEDPEGNMLTYHWDFGDGNTSDAESPLHEYLQPGEYIVKLVVDDGTKSKTHTVKVTINPFETQIEGGDEATLSIAMLAGVAAAVIVVVLAVLLLVLRRRRDAPDLAGQSSREEEWLEARPHEDLGNGRAHQAEEPITVTPVEQDEGMETWEERP